MDSKTCHCGTTLRLWEYVEQDAGIGGGASSWIAGGLWAGQGDGLVYAASSQDVVDWLGNWQPAHDLYNPRQLTQGHCREMTAHYAA